MVGAVSGRVMDAPDGKGNRVFHDGFNRLAEVDFYSFENNVIGKGDFAACVFIFHEDDAAIMKTF